jgi:heme oxygenase
VSARSALRNATAKHHRRVDDLFSRFPLGDTSGYRAFLRATARAHLSVERALDEAGAGLLLDDWPARRRGDDLRSDLDELGSEVPDAAPAPEFSESAAVLGAIYVLEGSRLGGRMLSRQVPARLPQSFLGAPGSSASWRSLLSVLDIELADQQKLRRASASACAVFDRFAAAAAMELEPVS